MKKLLYLCPMLMMKQYSSRVKGHPNNGPVLLKAFVMNTFFKVHFEENYGEVSTERYFSSLDAVLGYLETSEVEDDAAYTDWARLVRFTLNEKGEFKGEQLFCLDMQEIRRGMLAYTMRLEVEKVKSEAEKANYLLGL